MNQRLTVSFALVFAGALTAWAAPAVVREALGKAAVPAATAGATNARAPTAATTGVTGARGAAATPGAATDAPGAAATTPHIPFRSEDATPAAFSTAAAATLPAAINPPHTGPAPRLKVGVGTADATGHLGASAGQYADTVEDCGPGCVFPDKRDPASSSTIKKGSYGVASRLSARAIVVEGGDGKRVALLKTDHYLAQDYFARRIVQLLPVALGITADNLLHAATHNHSSPYQFTEAAGVWVFQDQYNPVVFEADARAAAAAITQAASNLKPARMGGTVVRHNVVKSNIVGPSIAIDGTPAGYPRDYGDDGLTVLRFDDLTDPAAPKPLAVWVNHGQHPESLDGAHLISEDYLAPLERRVQRLLGAVLVFSQGDVGSAEGPYDGRAETTALTGDFAGVNRAWAHSGYAQIERGGFLLYRAVREGFEAIGRGDAGVPVPFTTDPTVAFKSVWMPGPASHPYPSVSNCSAEQTYQGDPGVPAAGLPDCARAGDNGFPGLPDIAEYLPPGAPAPSHYDAPGHPAVEENTRMRLQTFRLGEVLLASCACEAQVDLILNLETRADAREGNAYDGFDWACLLPQFAAEAVCLTQREHYNPSVLPAIPGSVADAAEVAHFRAQVHNDARGWDDPANAVAAQGQEPADVTQIWGNFTKEELPASRGYKLPVGIGHAGDYNGYTLSYREYLSRDSYRKALTAYGPHTADYMVTRLVRMAGELKGGPAFTLTPAEQALATPDENRQVARTASSGAQAGARYDTRLDTLPDDPGAVAILTQPTDVQRYAAATLTWRGGANLVDQPVVTVERELADGSWAFFADQSGEVQTMLGFPDAAQLTTARAGQFEWVWRANFEAFMPFPKVLGDGTPDGRYRFVVKGASRKARATVPYTLTSNAFRIGPWRGIPVADYALDAASGDVRFATPAYTYPRTYATPFLVIADDSRANPCHTCSFRPWARTGTPQAATVTVTRRDGSTDTVPAVRGADGTWRATTQLVSGETATLAVGGVTDDNGETNGSPLAVTAPAAPAPAAFTFLRRTNVALRTIVTSEEVTLTGFTGPLAITLSGSNGTGGAASSAQYRINGGPFTSEPGTVHPGDRIAVRHVSAASENAVTTTLVRVGDLRTPFTTVTTTLDRVPDPFGFGQKEGQAPGVLVESAAIVLTGYDEAAIAAPTGCEYRIATGPWTRAAGKLLPGQTLQVRHAANTAKLGYTRSSLRVGGVVGTFTTRTR